MPSTIGGAATTTTATRSDEITAVIGGWHTCRLLALQHDAIRSFGADSDRAVSHGFTLPAGWQALLTCTTSHVQAHVFHTITGRNVAGLVHQATHLVAYRWHRQAIPISTEVISPAVDPIAPIDLTDPRAVIPYDTYLPVPTAECETIEAEAALTGLALGT